MQSTSNEQLNELKTQLTAREGTYELVPQAEYTRPKATTYAPNNGIGAGGTPNSTPVRVSFAKVYCTDVINSNSPATAGLNNPFLPTTHYNRLSHSNDGLNNINSNSVGVGTVATGTNTSNSSSSNAYLNHHNDTNDHSNLHNHNNSSSSDIRIDERIIFNIGREIFIFAFNGLQVRCLQSMNRNFILPNFTTPLYSLLILIR